MNLGLHTAYCLLPTAYCLLLSRVASRAINNSEFKSAN
jgi:hypothetical protein